MGDNIQRTLIVPDIHDKISPLETNLQDLDKEYNFDKIIFLGDYFDSFWGDHHVAEKTAYWLIKSIEDPKRIHLVGNHDIPYMSNYPAYRCPGTTPDKQKIIRDKDINWDKLYAAYHHQGYVFSHAGFAPELIGNLTGEEAVAYANDQFHNRVLKDEFSSLFLPGGRMGHDRAGGITWLNWEEYHEIGYHCYEEFEPVKQFNQIVGHSIDTKIRQNQGNFCIDCQLRYLIMIEDGVLYSIDRNKNFRKKLIKII